MTGRQLHAQKPCFRSSAWLESSRQLKIPVDVQRVSILLRDQRILLLPCTCLTTLFHRSLAYVPKLWIRSDPLILLLLVTNVLPWITFFVDMSFLSVGGTTMSLGVLADLTFQISQITFG